MRTRTSRWRQLFDDYTAGFRTEDLRRLFDRDAQRAYRVLTRDQPAREEPTRGVCGFLHRAKALFLGMSYKLTPARRIVFAAAMLFTVLGFAKFEIVANAHRIRIDFSPLWFAMAIASLVFLLALELVDRILVRDELEVARQLQKDLLPRQAPTLPGYAFAHSYRTANEVGGDYYDFNPLPDGRLALAVGDASGHGMAAGLLMAIANAVLKLAVELDPAPERVATLLNHVLCRTDDRRAFMSLFYAVLQPASGRLDHLCAGHPFPLLRRASGEMLELGRGGFPLGIRDALPLTSEQVVLAPGDTLLLYSDGLPEAVDRQGVAFGFERLQDLLKRGGDAQAVHDRVVAALAAHLAGEPPQDDVSIVVIARAAE